MDLKFIEEIISQADREIVVSNPLTTEEKLLATEQILTSYRETKVKTPEIRQGLIDEKIVLSKNSTEIEFSEVITRLDEDIKFINSYDDDDLYILDMTRRSWAMLNRSFVEMDRLDKRRDFLLVEIKNAIGLRSDSSIVQELETINNETQKTIKDCHVAKLLIFYFKKAWHKKSYPNDDVN